MVRLETAPTVWDRKKPHLGTNPVNLVSTYLAYWHGTEIAYILIIANNKIHSFTRK